MEPRIQYAQTRVLKKGFAILGEGTPPWPPSVGTTSEAGATSRLNGSPQMPDKQARACANAKKELDRIEAELREMAEFYFTVGAALEHSPPRLVIANSDLVQRPDIGPRWMVPSVDYLAWPDKEAVKEKLSDYFRAEEDYAQAWRALPSDVRSQFPRPKR